MPGDAKNGGSDARFTRLTEEFYDRVQRLVARFAKSEEDQQDLTHDTFLAIYKGLDSFRGESGIGTWIYRVTLNTCLAWAKQRGTELKRRLEPSSGQEDDNAETLLESLGAVGASQHEAASEGERARALHQAVSELPPAQRRAMQLYLKGYERREIARVLQVSEETVKTHLQEGRKRLRRVLGERFGQTAWRAEEDEGER